MACREQAGGICPPHLALLQGYAPGNDPSNPPVVDLGVPKRSSGPQAPTTKPLPEGWIPALDPAYVTIALTSFRVLTSLCTRLGDVQDRVIQYADNRYFSTIYRIETLEAEVYGNHERNKGELEELQEAKERYGWRLERLEFNDRFTMNRIQELSQERQEMLSAYRRLQEMVQLLLDSNRALRLQLERHNAD